MYNYCKFERVLHKLTRDSYSFSDAYRKLNRFKFRNGVSLTKYQIKYLLYLFVLLLIVSKSNMVSPITEITFVNVYGDAILIKDSFDQCNIIVDTGTNDEYNTFINYIRSKNIKRIDYLIITHNHEDHYGESNDILNTFDVTNIITNSNDIEYINCGNFTLEFFLITKTYDNENNNSVVFKLYYNNESYLFTGDIEQEREQELYMNYNISADYLKSPHHGSDTSSSIKFIEAVSPKETYITAYYKNKHNHPNDTIVNLYNQKEMKTYRCDLDGTFSIKYIFNIRFVFTNKY